jgi:hypothetical protein
MNKTELLKKIPKMEPQRSKSVLMLKFYLNPLQRKILHAEYIFKQLYPGLEQLRLRMQAADETRRVEYLEKHWEPQKQEKYCVINPLKQK